MAIERGGGDIVFLYDGGRANTCEFPSRTLDLLFTAAGVLAATTFSSEFVERLQAADEHDFLVYAATSQDAGLVGYAFAYRRSPDYANGPCREELHLDQVVVAKEYRSHGIGRFLVDLISEIAAEERITLTAWTLKSQRRFFSMWCFYEVDPPVEDREAPPTDSVFMHSEHALSSSASCSSYSGA